MYRKAVFPLLARLDAEQVHDITVKLLGRVSRSPMLLGLIRRYLQVNDEHLHVRAFGRTFANPLGVAAGLDKNGVAVTAFGALGFGHVEVGTVTPKAQIGNSRPRVFRLPQDDALINRMGFPGVGSLAVLQHLGRLRGLRPIIGINLGANKLSVEQGRAAADYVHGIEQLATHADYLVINISSPNTARLRDLQGSEALTALLAIIMESRNRLVQPTPLLVKIAPDLSPAELDAVLRVVLDHQVDGIIATNTTLDRPGSLQHPAQRETGGLSGRPLRSRANDVIRAMYQATGGHLPIIGVGGVFTADDVWDKLLCGACLVQVYTGLIYGGPLLAQMINCGLVERMRVEGVQQLEAIIGQDGVTMW